MKPPLYWQSKTGLAKWLQPLSLLFSAAASCRRCYYRWRPPSPLSVPVIVIGNITVGGAGKTPIVIECAKQLTQAGWVVGIISRGYGRQSHQTLIATKLSTATEIGDEPLLIYQKLLLPLAVSATRIDAAKCLIENFPEINLIISDDGLQHYALPRTVEVIVVGEQAFGNGYLLPAGPLREPLTRLKSADIILYHTTPPLSLQEFPHQYHIQRALSSHAYRLDRPNEIKPLTYFKDQKLLWVAGIAYPEPFFTALQQHNLNGTARAFDDHHMYVPSDLCGDFDTILMTEKDAVKCRHLGLSNIWVVPLIIHWPKACTLQIHAKLSRYSQAKHVD